MALKLSSQSPLKPALLKPFLSQKVEALFCQFWLIDKTPGNLSQLLLFSSVPHQKILLALSSNRCRLLLLLIISTTITLVKATLLSLAWVIVVAF